jgi:hypothetical protein
MLPKTLEERAAIRYDVLGCPTKDGNGTALQEINAYHLSGIDITLRTS